MPFSIAHFCKAQGVLPSYSREKDEYSIACPEHGSTQLVLYHSISSDNRVANRSVWTCIKCFEKWVNNGPVLVAVKKEYCARCHSDKSVVACDVCGLFVCSEHRIEGVCDECYESTSNFFGVSWRSL